MARRLEVPGQRRDALLELRVRGVAGCRQAGQVALDVGHEDGHAGLRQLPGEQLEGLRLAGPGRAGDQAVPVEHGQRDLHPGVVEDLAVVHRTADDQTRLRQGVASRHRLSKRLVHVTSGSADRVFVWREARVSSARPTTGRDAPREAGWIAEAKTLPKIVEH